jgi:hypothetical protein
MMQDPRNDIRSQVRQNASYSRRSGGNLIGAGIDRSGLLGDSITLNPQMKKATDMRQIQAEAGQRFEPSTPEYFGFVASEMSNRGYHNEAMKAQEYGLAMEQKRATLADTQRKASAGTKAPTTKPVLNTKTGLPEFRSDREIAASNGLYTPIPPNKDKKKVGQLVTADSEIGKSLNMPLGTIAEVTDLEEKEGGGYTFSAYDDITQKTDKDGSSSSERLIARATELQIKESKGTITPEETIELDNTLPSVTGKRVFKTVQEDGSVAFTDNRGRVKEVLLPNGEPLQDIRGISEERQKNSSIRLNQQSLNSTLKSMVGSDIDFVKDTRRVNLNTGRESVDDTRLTFMFARTLPGVGKEIAQGDLERLADTSSIPEGIAVAIKGVLTGKTLPADVRDSFKRTIVLERAIRAEQVRKTITDLNTQATNTDTPWNPVGMAVGSDLNPHVLNDKMTVDDIKDMVKDGQWFIDTDGSLIQNSKGAK